MVFYISCAFLVTTNIIYILFATGKTQPWNTPGMNVPLENGIKKEGVEENFDEDSENSEKALEKKKNGLE